MLFVAIHCYQKIFKISYLAFFKYFCSFASGVGLVLNKLFSGYKMGNFYGFYQLDSVKFTMWSM